MVPDGFSGIGRSRTPYPVQARYRTYSPGQSRGAANDDARYPLRQVIRSHENGADNHVNGVQREQQDPLDEIRDEKFLRSLAWKFTQMRVDPKQGLQQPCCRKYKRNTNDVNVYGVLGNCSKLPKGAPASRVGTASKCEAIREEPGKNQQQHCCYVNRCIGHGSVFCLLFRF